METVSRIPERTAIPARESELIALQAALDDFADMIRRRCNPSLARIDVDPDTHLCRILFAEGGEWRVGVVDKFLPRCLPSLLSDICQQLMR